MVMIISSLPLNTPVSAIFAKITFFRFFYIIFSAHNISKDGGNRPVNSWVEYSIMRKNKWNKPVKAYTG